MSLQTKLYYKLSIIVIIFISEKLKSKILIIHVIRDYPPCGPLKTVHLGRKKEKKRPIRSLSYETAFLYNHHLFT